MGGRRFVEGGRVSSRRGGFEVLFGVRFRVDLRFVSFLVGGVGYIVWIL